MPEMASPSAQGGRLCPSSRAEAGAVLLGIVSPDGKIAYLTPQMRISADFVETSRQGRSPEKRFRFSGPCVEGNCAQWTGTRCGVIDAALENADSMHLRANSPDAVSDQLLPNCSIRQRCRWFSQHGRQACRVCPYIITDARPED